MSDRQAALDMALKQIEKQFGKGSIMKLGEKTDTRISTVPSGSLALDTALGIGGYPRGRIIEVYGPESSGKTTVALHAIAEVQQQGGQAAFIDAEHALDPVYAQSLESISKSFYCLSLTQVSRRLKLRKRWFEAVQLTLLLSTLWRLSFRKRKLKATWEIRMSVYKLA